MFGLLGMFSSPNIGESRLRFAAFLMAMLGYFVYNQLSQVDTGWYQIASFSVLMPFSMMAIPFLYFFLRSLMEKHIIADYSIPMFFHFIPAFFAIGTVVAGFLFLDTDQINDIITRQKDIDQTKLKVGRIVLMSVHFLYYAQMVIYFEIVNRIFQKQKRIYGKYFGSYELRNEVRALRILVAMIALAIYDIVFWVFEVQNPYVIITMNFLAGLAVTLIIVSGRDQIGIKRYRIYKLRSHHHELE